MAIFDSLSIHDVTQRLYGVRTRVESRLETIDGTNPRSDFELRQNVNRIGLLIQNLSAANNLVLQWGDDQPNDSVGVPGGQVVTPNGTVYVTVYEDLSFPSERVRIINASATVDVDVYVTELLIASVATPSDDL